MKLALCAVLSFAVIGCVDDVSTGGGQQEGIEPDKLSDPDPGNDPLDTPFDVITTPDRLAKPMDRMMDHFQDNLVDPDVFTSITTAGCKGGCEVHATVETFPGLEEIVYYVNHIEVCRIFRDETGILYSDCN